MIRPSTLGAAGASGAAAGVLVGGVLTGLAGWRWVLFINVPVGTVLVAAAVVALAESTAGLAHRHMDLAGAVTVTAGMTALVYGVISAQARTWGSPVTLGALAAAVVLLAVFAATEARLTPHPLVPMHLFRQRALAMANVIGVANGAGLFAMYIFLSLYLQQASHYSPLGTGLAFVPVALSTMAGALYGARLVARVGLRRQLAVGLLAGAAGMYWLSRLTAGAPYAGHVLAPLVLAGTGFGMSIVPLTMGATAGVPVSQAGLASGLIQTSRQIGGAIGLAAMGTAAAAVTSRARSGSVADALASGYDRAFTIAAVTLLAGAALTPLLPGTGQRASQTRPPGRGGEARDDDHGDGQVQGDQPGGRRGRGRGGQRQGQGKQENEHGDARPRRAGPGRGPLQHGQQQPAEQRGDQGGADDLPGDDGLRAHRAEADA